MRKNNLDEMQEKKLLKIEHYGMWIAFWGLVAAVIIQLAVGTDFKQFAGEWLILMVVSLYTLIACLKNGIWDRHLKPNFKTNALVSLLAALAVAFVSAFTCYRQGVPAHFLTVTVALTGAFTYLLCIGALQLSSFIYRKRKEKLENQGEEEN